MGFPKDFIDSVPLNEVEKANLLEALKGKALFSLRINPNKNFSELQGEQVPWCENGKYIQERPSYIEDPLFHAGCFYPQEASSMFLEQAIKPFLKPNMNVLDLCAAPGGKSTHLLSLLPSDALLVSNEVIKSRAQILKENIIKWGKSTVVVTQNDANDFKKLPSFFDLMVLDVPCSGEGMFRKNPEAISQWNSQNVELCCARQKRIVADVWDSLKENGILIYSTCTFNRKENEENLLWLLDNFEAESIALNIPSDWGIQEIKEPSIFAYRFFPDKVKGEGFFMAAFRKNSGKSTYTFSKKAKPLPTLKNNPFKECLTISNEYLLTEFQQEIVVFPVGKSMEAAEIISNLNPIKLGCAVGEVINGKTKFAHDIALSSEFELQLPKAELNLQQALQYLSKHDVWVPNQKNGWILFTHKNVNLGLGKVVGNRINNYYPSYYRIRKNLE